MYNGGTRDDKVLKSDVTCTIWKAKSEQSATTLCVFERDTLCEATFNGARVHYTVLKRGKAKT